METKYAGFTCKSFEQQILYVCKQQYEYGKYGDCSDYLYDISMTYNISIWVLRYLL